MATDVSREVLDEDIGVSTFKQGADALTTMGHSLWEYQGNVWVLKSCRCTPGHEPGPPPEERGKYEGEIKRKVCGPTTS